MTEIYKIINHIAPSIMSSLFEIPENTHNTRHFQVLSNESRRTVNYGNIYQLKSAISKNVFSYSKLALLLFD